MDFLDIFKIVTSVVGSFSIIATVTPNKADNVIADVLVRIVNFLGANFGNAKNER